MKKIINRNITKKHKEEMSAKLKAVGTNTKKPISKKLIKEVIDDLLLGSIELDGSDQYYFTLKYILFTNDSEVTEISNKCAEIVHVVFTRVNNLVDKVHGCIQTAKIPETE